MVPSSSDDSVGHADLELNYWWNLYIVRGTEIIYALLLSVFLLIKKTHKNTTVNLIMYRR